MDWVPDKMPEWVPDWVDKKVLIGGAVIGLAYLFLWRRKSNMPPGPTPLPLLGNLLTLMRSSDRSFEVLTKLSEKYGDVYTFHFGSSKAVVLNSLEVIREALVTKQNDFAGRPDIFSVNLVTQGGKDIAFGQFTPTWQMHRKIVHAAIRNYSSGENLEGRVREGLDKAIAKMKSEKGPFDPKAIINYYVYNIICGMAFEKIYDIDDPEYQYLTGAMEELEKVFGSGVPEDYIPFLKHICLSPRMREVKKIFEEFISFVTNVMEQHKKVFDPDNLRDLTDYLIHTQRSLQESEDEEVLSGITDTHMVQTIGNFFTAGTDTTRYTIYWVLSLLAANPGAQKKMQQQIDDVCGSRQVTMKDRSKLPYVEAVLFECMRYGTVGPNALPHTTTCDTSVGGYDIPKGTNVLVNIYALHYNKKFWKDPEKFKPERFLDTDGALSPKPSHFMPFSAGRRVCVGEILVKHGLFLFIASLYQQLDIVAPPGVKFTAEHSDYNMACTAKEYQVVVRPRE